jgi:hypothetical protein
MTFDLVGKLDECFLLSYAVDPGRAASLVPSGLELLTHQRCAFLNIVVCHVERMRPRFAPRAVGVTYWHVAYRLQVRARLSGGASIDGLYFLRSDVDTPLLGAVGNRLTDFRFHHAEMRFRAEPEGCSLKVDGGNGAASAMLRPSSANEDDCRPPFSSIEERERLLKYAPFGLSISRSGRLRVAEARRDEALWKEAPIAVASALWRYPLRLGLDTQRLVRATRVAPIDYAWRMSIL